MKFSIEPKDLKRALTILKPCIAKRSTKKIFECVRLEARDGTLTASGTDLEWAAVVDASAQVAGEGVRVVPLFELLKLAKLKADRLDFSSVGPLNLRAEWTGAKTSANRVMEGEDPTQFPEIPADVEPLARSLWPNTPNIGSVLVESLSFCGKEAVRFVLNGVRIGNGRVVATDGRRLYVRSVDGLDGTAAIIGVQALARLPKPVIQAIDRCWITDRFVRFGGEGFVLSCRVMEGTFPDYSQIMPQGLLSCAIDADAWLEALEAVDGCTSIKQQAVVLTFHGNVKVSATGGDAKGEATIPQDTGALEGVGPLGFNPSYLRDFLKLNPTRFSAKDANSATLFTTENGAELVLMPVLV